MIWPMDLAELLRLSGTQLGHVSLFWGFQPAGACPVGGRLPILGAISTVGWAMRRASWVVLRTAAATG
jgi:hypothetical protein